MRYSTVVVGAFAALAAAQTSTPATSPVPTQTYFDPAQSSIASAEAKCLAACPAGDVNCQAKCLPVPSPDEGQVNETNKCVAACPQGNGTAADIDRYGKCVTNCINTHFLTASAPGSQPTGTAGNGNGNGNGQGTGAGGASNTGTGGAGPQSTSKAAAEILQVGGSAVGILGFLAAFLAL